MNCPICQSPMIKRAQRWYCMRCDHLVTFRWRHTVRSWVGGKLENNLDTYNAGSDPAFAWRLVESSAAVNYDPWLESRLEAIIS